MKWFKKKHIFTKKVSEEPIIYITEEDIEVHNSGNIDIDIIIGGKKVMKFMKVVKVI